MDLDSLAGNHLRAPHAEITTEFLCRSLTALYFALVETFPDKEVSIRLNAATKVPQFFSPAAGDWIEAEVTPDMFAKTIHRSKPSYTMEGDILKVEGDRLLMQDPTGKEVSLRLTKDTKSICTSPFVCFVFLRVFVMNRYPERERVKSSDRRQAGT